MTKAVGTAEAEEASTRLLGALRRRFDPFYTGVPCSLLGGFLDELIRGGDFNVATSEGEALAMAAGAWLAGRTPVCLLQNSGLGNLVNPFMSLNRPFAIPVMMLVTWRGEPGTGDEPQHGPMGEATLGMLDLMGVVHRPFPTGASELEEALDQAGSLMAARRSVAWIVRKGDLPEGAGLPPAVARPPAATFEAPRRERGRAAPTASRYEAIEAVLRTVPADGAVIAATGKCGRELFTIADREAHLYLVGAMGYAGAVGLGVALNSDRPVVVLDGDGGCLMHMGTMATIGAARAENLLHVVLDNASYDSTGGQPAISGRIDFCGIASSCGYAGVSEASDVDGAVRALRDRPQGGAGFLRFRVRPGSPSGLGRPTVPPDAVATRFAEFLRRGRPRRSGVGTGASEPRGRSSQPLLFTPGPLTTDPSVRTAMARRDWGSREPDFVSATGEFRDRILRAGAFASGFECIPVAGSGTTAVEAMLLSFAPRRRTTLVLVNGSYGERMVAILERARRPVTALRSSWTLPVDPGAVARTLERERGIGAIAVVHGETTAGVLNPLEEVARLADAAGLALLVDGMSTFPVQPTGAVLHGRAALASSVNKALEGAPGIGFVVAGNELLAGRHDGGDVPLTLDLRDQLASFRATGEWRFTPPTHVLAAGLRALDLLDEEGGPDARRHRYRAVQRRLVAGLEGLGIRCIVEPAHRLPLIATFEGAMLGGPEEILALRSKLRESGLVVYAGKMPGRSVFRVGCIGRVDEASVDDLVARIGAHIGESANVVA